MTSCTRGLEGRTSSPCTPCPPHLTAQHEDGANCNFPALDAEVLNLASTGTTCPLGTPAMGPRSPAVHMAVATRTPTHWPCPCLRYRRQQPAVSWFCQTESSASGRGGRGV
eukprot:CAMPEP_0173063486 /NCGR_PEP_ID=MMETSP1102-20130122/4416_1 /TAXON_ID=49646 /ORGANISM="Geminigera sp., Strain Caron Lab Isolate" /LENGTH=110 /DNA_ID=CAMNT_0013930305 /DNA_START=722 /DNA_END=1054 /DNA_ORIENTATION=+